MDGSSELAVVALFKAGADSDAEDPKDRYTSILKANNYSGISVPCLSFQFQLDHLRQCLARPEKYSGKSEHSLGFFKDCPKIIIHFTSLFLMLRIILQLSHRLLISLGRFDFDKSSIGGSGEGSCGYSSGWMEGETPLLRRRANA